MRTIEVDEQWLRSQFVGEKKRSANRVAAALGCDRRTIYRLCERYGIDRGPRRRSTAKPVIDCDACANLIKCQQYEKSLAAGFGWNNFPCMDADKAVELEGEDQL